ncbi:MAG: SDR family oxidoreductase [Betaproteobacteria bacterium]
MKILVTGNMGYVGPAVISHLRAVFPDASIAGFDSGLFAHCLSASSRLPESIADAQYFGDVREFPAEILAGVDAVVHLAAVSNDPMGSRFENVTMAINHRASVAIAKAALKMGVKSFVFASSCSMYGFAEGGPRREGDVLNPLTAYARSKVAVERELSTYSKGTMVITALRFSTACGMSDRVRLDLVLNDFVACAIASREISVLSDGTPWRPLIDIKDMARAIEWAVIRKNSSGGQYLAVNVGSDQWNYQVEDLARAVAKAIPSTKVKINKNAPPDRRSYQVDFSKFRQFAPSHQPRVGLEQAIRELQQGLESMSFRDANFRLSQFMRLKVLEKHIADGRITNDLRWSR